MPTLRELLASRLRDALIACDLDSARADVSQAADARFGDYQANAAMVLAKEKKAKLGLHEIMKRSFASPIFMQ